MGAAVSQRISMGVFGCGLNLGGPRLRGADLRVMCCADELGKSI